MKDFMVMVLVLALAPFVGRAQNYHLTVTLKGLKTPSKAWLVYEYGMTDQRVLDSAASKDGVFSFKGAAGDPPVKAELVIDHSGQGLKSLGRKADRRVVYLEKGRIGIKGNDSLRHTAITGSPLNREYVRYNAAVLSPCEKVVKAVDAEYNAAPDDKKKDKEFTGSLMTRVKEALKERDSLKYVYIRQNPDSYFSLEALQELTGRDIDRYKIEPVFKGLSPGLRKSKAGMDFAKLLYDQGPTSIGSMAPDFIQKDVDDRPVKLSDFKGKYVLLDFWASWCGPCRAENPNVVKAYNKYKDKNFTVLSVSLDQPGKKDAWLAAIKKDSLSWTQVSDLMFWNNAVAKQYAITSIPQNFLIDPTGKIVAKNLRGETLNKKLEELF